QQTEIKRLIGMQRLERLRQTREMIRHSSDLDLGARQIEIGGHDEQVIAARGGDFFYNGGFAKQRFVKTGLLDSLQTKRACCIGLRIKIDKQNVQVHLCQRRPEIYGRGRL